MHKNLGGCDGGGLEPESPDAESESEAPGRGGRFRSMKLELPSLGGGGWVEE